MKKFKFICITFIISSLLLCGCYNSNNVQDTTTTTDNTKPQPQEVLIETITFKGIITDITQQPSDKSYFNITLK